jgi:hypothetical protein
MKHLCHYIFILLSVFLFAACGKKTDAVQFQADADSLVEAKMQEAISLQEKNEQLTSELSREDSLLARFEVSGSPSDKLKLNPTTEESTDTVPKLTPQQVDSVVFRLTHHYGPNFNFELKADSMILVPREGDLIQDTCVVRNKDLLVVAQIKRIEASDSTMEDTFLIKVAHDQTTMGWVKESELLENAVPDDPISQLIDFMTGSRAIWMSSFLGFGVIAFFFRKMRKQKIVGISHIGKCAIWSTHYSSPFLLLFYALKIVDEVTYCLKLSKDLFRDLFKFKLLLYGVRELNELE